MNNDSLEKKVEQALLRVWDPIGINDIEEASDEYNNYVIPICGLIEAACSQDDLFEFLWTIETQHMGLVGNKEETVNFCRYLLELNRL